MITNSMTTVNIIDNSQDFYFKLKSDDWKEVEVAEGFVCLVPNSQEKKEELKKALGTSNVTIWNENTAQLTMDLFK
jgi:hypothetical protein